VAVAAVAGSGAGAGAGAGSGAELADGAGLAVPEPVPVAVAPAAPAGELGADEATGAAAELTVEAIADGAELTVEATGDAAELAAEVIGDTAELTVEVTVETVDVCVDVRGGSAAVAACAGRENTSMIVKIPAAASAACTATRAMRRAIGCSMSSSHSTRDQAARLPNDGRGKPRMPGLAVRSPPYSAIAEPARARRAGGPKDATGQRSPTQPGSQPGRDPEFITRECGFGSSGCRSVAEPKGGERVEALDLLPVTVWRCYRCHA
jgi:hypothetical protein